MSIFLFPAALLLAQHKTVGKECSGDGDCTTGLCQLAHVSPEPAIGVCASEVDARLAKLEKAVGVLALGAMPKEKNVTAWQAPGPPEASGRYWRCICTHERACTHWHRMDPQLTCDCEFAVHSRL